MNKLSSLLIGAIATLLLATGCLTIHEKETLPAPWVPEYRDTGAAESILYIVKDNQINWESISGVKALKLVYGTAYDANDAEATFKLASDNERLYFRVEVSDDKLLATDLPISEAWNADSIEIFIGQETKKHTSFARTDHAVRLAFRSDGTVALGLDNKEIESDASYEILENGCVATFSLPLETLGFSPLAAGKNIRAEYGLNDADGSGGRDVRLHWSNKADEAYANPSLWGDVIVREVL